MLVYDGFDPAEEGLRETLTSTGNGYFCTRGTAEWEDAGRRSHYPGTYAHGVYNRETTIMGGHPVPNEDLVNLPNWLVLKLRIEGEEPLRLANVELLSYRHALRLPQRAGHPRAALPRSRGPRDQLAQPPLREHGPHAPGGARLGPHAGELVGQRSRSSSALDGRVLNQGVARYRQLEGRHLDPQGPRIYGTDVIALKARTRQSRIEVAEAARTRVYRGDEELDVARTHRTRPRTTSSRCWRSTCERGRARARREARRRSTRRATARSTSRWRTRSRASPAIPRFDEALAGHAGRVGRALGGLRRRASRASERAQFLLRFHISHVLQVCSRLTAHHDAGVPARGLNGEAYRGHVFWDELFVYPFLNFRLPGDHARPAAVPLPADRRGARGGARDAATAGRCSRGRAAATARRRPSVVHLNPLSGRWDPDLSRNQRHVNAAIFYNVWHYYQATHDLDFLRDYGAEMMLEIARFWSSIAHFNPERDRWEIHGVMGPDEFHEKYPGATEGGLRNNAYTNVMVAWICEIAQQVLELLPASRRDALRARIGLQRRARSRRWEEMSRRMFVPFHDDGVISQFEGYEDLEELDWDAYRARYGNIQRLDRILRAEGDDPNRYKLAKQADTVMLFFLFSDDRAAAALRAARLRVRARHRAQDDRLLRPADLARVDAELRSSTPASWPPSIPRARGSGSWSRSRATSATSRAGRRRRASTWA